MLIVVRYTRVQTITGLSSLRGFCRGDVTVLWCDFMMCTLWLRRHKQDHLHWSQACIRTLVETHRKRRQRRRALLELVIVWLFFSGWCRKEEKKKKKGSSTTCVTQRSLVIISVITACSRYGRWLLHKHNGIIPSTRYICIQSTNKEKLITTIISEGQLMWNTAHKETFQLIRRPSCFHLPCFSVLVSYNCSSAAANESTIIPHQEFLRRRVFRWNSPLANSRRHPHSHQVAVEIFKGTFCNISHCIINSDRGRHRLQGREGAASSFIPY